MELFHTSPSEINEINQSGRFGEFLCFAPAEYVMTAGDYVVYKLDLDDSAIIDAEQIFYHPDAPAKLGHLVARVMKMAGCDEDTAEELISQRADVHNIDTDIEPDDLADVSWDIQRMSGEAAMALGFRGVAMNDEQGRAYLIHMTGHESELELAC